jgi:prevent-host-death family protein
MKAIAIHDAKTNLSKYIAAAKKGETIYIGSRGKPEVKLVVTQPTDLTRPKRQLGVLKGKLSSEEVRQLLEYDKHKDPEWQQMVEEMYNKPLEG